MKSPLPAEAPKPGAFRKAGAQAAAEPAETPVVEEAPAAEAGGEDAQ